MNKIIMITVTILLFACGSTGFIGIPKLKAGETIIWHYVCEKAQAVNVEYAYMGDNYTATIQFAGNKDKKVLEQMAELSFALGKDWRWYSTDSKYFDLIKEGKSIRTACVAMNEIASDAMVHYSSLTSDN